MTDEISAGTLRAWLYDGAELALLDVREPGEIAEGHILFSAPLPYSRFETGLARLAPNPAVRMVLVDGGDGVAARAADRARAMGYGNVSWLGGGVDAWAQAGHTLYQGVNVPSKAFGELVEHACDTPHISPAELEEMRAAGDMIIVDGRTPAEFARMNIPGAMFCPNGELALRIGRLAPDPQTTVVVNCAGRTRSIIGAQTLIDLGLPNRVVALENGTQGWTLAGLTLEHGAEPGLPEPGGDLEARRERAVALARQHGVETVAPAALGGWLGDAGRTTYLLDVRTTEERDADRARRRALLDRHDVAHAPGGQLVQATDQWVGVRNARVVVLDVEGLRAPVVASWLARQGHAAAVLEGGLDGLDGLAPRPAPAAPELPVLQGIGADALKALRDEGRGTVVDVRSSDSFREGHLEGAIWTLRPRIAAAAGDEPHVLVADDVEAAALAAADLSEAGATEILLLEGGMPAWKAAGQPAETTPDMPADAERIDFIAFTAGRHDGDAEASRRYLSWEIGLVGQLDPDERAVFRI